MMNERVKRFSFTDLSHMEEMKSKLQKLNSVRHTTNAIIAQFDIHPKINTKRKTSVQQKSIDSMAKRRTLQPLPTDKRISHMKTPVDIDLKPEIV
jgi:hypothetical protein